MNTDTNITPRDWDNNQMFWFENDCLFEQSANIKTLVDQKREVEEKFFSTLRGQRWIQTANTKKRLNWFAKPTSNEVSLFLVWK